MFLAQKLLRQGIRSFIYLALAVIDLEIVTRKFLSLADLSRAQTLHLHELFEFVMFSKHKDFMLGAF